MSILNSNAENDENGNMRCSARPNKGDGGTLVQLTNVSAAIKKQLRVAKKLVKDIPLTQGVNHMAPENTKGPGEVGMPFKQGTSTVSDPLFFADSTTVESCPAKPCSNHSVISSDAFSSFWD